MTQPEELKDKVEATALVAGGTAAGAGVSAVVGGMGLVGGFGGVAIGAAPVMAAGAVVGSAAYGAKKALEEGDATAIGVVAGGAVAGAGVSAVVGGMGLAVGGTAVAVGAAPIVAAGAVVGLAAYGLKKLFESSSSGEVLDTEQAIATKLEADLKAAQQANLREDQAARDQFWSRRDAQQLQSSSHSHTTEESEMSYEEDGVYVLEIYHQSGKLSREEYNNCNRAWQGYHVQRQHYGKRKLKLYAIASKLHASGTLLASHNFPKEEKLQQYESTPVEQFGEKYFLKIYHQSGRITEKIFNSQESARAEFNFQQRHYGKRRLKLYAFSDANPELRMIASH